MERVRILLFTLYNICKDISACFLSVSFQSLKMIDLSNLGNIKLSKLNQNCEIGKKVDHKHQYQDFKTKTRLFNVSMISDAVNEAALTFYVSISLFSELGCLNMHG